MDTHLRRDVLRRLVALSEHVAPEGQDELDQLMQCIASSRVVSEADTLADAFKVKLKLGNAFHHAAPAPAHAAAPAAAPEAEEAGSLADALRAPQPGDLLKLVHTLPKANYQTKKAGCFRIAVASAANSGKSHLVAQLLCVLKALHLIDAIALFSESVGLNEDFNRIIPIEHQHRFSTGKLNQLIARAERLIREGRYEHLVVVLDDVMGTEADRSKAIAELYTRGRHKNISVVVLSQVSNHLLSPTIKTNSTHIIFGRLNAAGYDDLAKKSVHGFNTTKGFRDWVDQHLAKFVFGVIAQEEGRTFAVKAPAEPIVAVSVPAPSALPTAAAAGAGVWDDDDL